MHDHHNRIAVLWFLLFKRILLHCFSLSHYHKKECVDYYNKTLLALDLGLHHLHWFRKLERISKVPFAGQSHHKDFNAAAVATAVLLVIVYFVDLLT
jgi:hypothetical protein